MAVKIFAVFLVLVGLVYCRDMDVEMMDDYSPNYEYKLDAIKEDRDTRLSKAVIHWLESNRDMLTKPIPKFNLPQMDPFKMNYYDINLVNGTILGYLKEVVVTGVSDFKILNLELDKFNATVMIPLVHIQGLYKVEGDAQGIHLFGDGGLDITMTGPYVSAEVIVVFDESRLQIQNLTLDIGLAGLQVKIENLMGGGKIGDILNDMISGIGPEAVDAMKGDVLPKVADMIVKQVNKVLSETPLLQGGKTSKTGVPCDNSHRAIINAIVENAEPLIMSFAGAHLFSMD